MPPEQDAPEVLETPEEVVEEKPVVEEDKIDAEKEELKRQNEELVKKNKQLFERAKKQPQPDGLTNKDVLFLAKADIHEDDIDDVTELARLKKIPVSEAYKFLKPILDVRGEERKTAAATNTRGGQRTVSKTTGEDLLRKAQTTGEVPTDATGMQELFLARRAAQKK